MPNPSFQKNSIVLYIKHDLQNSINETKRTSL